MMQPVPCTAEEKIMGSLGERDHGDDIDRAARRVVEMVDEAVGGGNEVISTVDGQRKDEWGAPERERECGDRIDRAARRVMGMVGDSGVEGGMMQPALSTAKGNMNGGARGARAW